MQAVAGLDLVKGEGDAKVNALQLLGPLIGMTFSRGAPGGPALGELYHARQMHQYQIDSHIQDIQRQFLRGDKDGAVARMTALHIPEGLQRWYMSVWPNPALRLSPTSCLRNQARTLERLRAETR